MSRSADDASPTRQPPLKRFRGPGKRPSKRELRALAPSTSAPSSASAPSSCQAASRVALRPEPQQSKPPSSARGKPISKGPSTVHPDVKYPMYRDGVLDGVVHVCRLDECTYAAQKLDPAGGVLTEGANAWTHITSQIHGDFNRTYRCVDCDDFPLHRSCVHTMLLQSSDLPLMVPFSTRVDPPCILFRYVKTDAGVEAFFSCLSPSKQQKTKRAFVSFWRGHDGPSWTCSTHRGLAPECEHVHIARKRWKEMKEFVEEDDDLDTESDMGMHHTEVEEIRESTLRAAQREDAAQQARENEVRSISHLPVSPPRWARLKGDEAPFVTTVSPLPDHFSLGRNPRCRCGAPPLPDAEVHTVHCKLYTSEMCQPCTVEVARCSSCPLNSRAFAGPDLGEFGIFNLNNTTLFTHECLNEYSNRFTKSEVPFFAYINMVQCRYVDNASQFRFVCKKTFERAWFSLHLIQKLDVSFSCPHCGMHPKIVVADGVTAGFCARFKTSSLRPPTVQRADSIHRKAVVPMSATAIFGGTARKDALQLVKWWRAKQRGKHVEMEEAGNVEDADVPDADVDFVAADEQGKSKQQKQAEQEAARMAARQGIVDKIVLQNTAVGTLLFMYVFGHFDNQLALDLYGDFLEQLFAYESVLQFAPEKTWGALRILVDLGTTESAMQLVKDTGTILLSELPAVGNIVHHELATRPSLTAVLCESLDFIIQRAIAVQVMLLKPGSDVSAAASQAVVEQEDFHKDGSYYPAPRLRSRPYYDGLRNDNLVERSDVSDNGGIGCPKHYQLYGKKGVTGGLMGLWCVHGICVGFHCIPKGEGRNDVFSALFCYWPQAPDVVIYDFACALAPYCMLREPEFFKHTRFLIDQFHAQGHTRCSKACFLSNYASHKLALQDINDSVAEMGNSGLRLVRKSMRYMRQDHAVVFLHVFLMFWNWRTLIHGKHFKNRRRMA